MKLAVLFFTMMLGGCGLLGGAGLTGPAPQGQLVAPEALAPLAAPPAGRALWAELGQDAGVARPVRQEGPRYFWRMDEGFVFVTEGARVVATAGLPTMLLASTPIGGDPLRRLARGRCGWRIVLIWPAPRGGQNRCASASWCNAGLSPRNPPLAA
jgi:hypothetical protein